MYDVEFQFPKNGLDTKVLKDTGMNNCDECPTSTRLEVTIRKDDNNPLEIINCTYAYTYVIGMMLYLASNTWIYIPFDVHWRDQFTNNTNEQHDNTVKSICMYL